MPVLDGGTGPLEEEWEFKSLRVGGEGQPLQLRGELEVLQEPGATVLRATGPNELLGLGLHHLLHLNEVLFVLPLLLV